MVLRLLENTFVISKYWINLFLLMPPRNTLPDSDHHAQVEGNVRNVTNSLMQECLKNIHHIKIIWFHILIFTYLFIELNEI